jgi:hypothetical protein
VLPLNPVERLAKNILKYRLADQAFNSFSAFPEDAMVRIKPKEVKKTGKVPTNGSIFFTIFHITIQVPTSLEQFPSNLKCNSGFPCASG